MGYNCNPLHLLCLGALRRSHYSKLRWLKHISDVVRYFLLLMSGAQSSSGGCELDGAGGLPHGACSHSGDIHTAVSRLVEEVVAWQKGKATQRIPRKFGDNSDERRLGMRFAKLLLRREKGLGARPSEVQLSPVEVALVNSVPGVPFRGCSVHSGVEQPAGAKLVTHSVEASSSNARSGFDISCAKKARLAEDVANIDVSQRVELARAVPDASSKPQFPAAVSGQATDCSVCSSGGIGQPATTMQTHGQPRRRLSAKSTACAPNADNSGVLQNVAVSQVRNLTEDFIETENGINHNDSRTAACPSQDKPKNIPASVEAASLQCHYGRA